MNQNNAKNEARTIRSEEVGGLAYSPDSRREAGAGLYSGSNGDFSSRISGTPGAGANPNFLALLTGGIISQLIADAEDRLGQSQECIEWYEREKQENVKRLENLRKLQRLAEQQQQANGNQVDE